MLYLIVLVYTETMKYSVHIFIFIFSYIASYTVQSSQELSVSDPIEVEPIEVTVGMYPFAPFVEQNEQGVLSGMTLDLLTALNNQQRKYIFKPFVIPPKRRYLSYQKGDYDLMFYENSQWSWSEYDVDVSDVYQLGGEVYVALKKEGRGQEYFDDLTNKRMMGILGFHYGFTNFKTDEAYLREEFNMALVNSNDKNLSKLLTGRGDIALFNKAYLQRYAFKNPKIKDKLLVSEKLDQEYRHAVLVRPGSQPSVEEINIMLKSLQQSGIMASLWRKYGIKANKKLVSF